MTVAGARPAVVIVGGGVIGTSSAWRVAAEMGDRVEVVLLEADAIGSGSTSRAVGEVETQYLGLEDIEPRVESMRVLSELESQGRITIHRNGYLRLARSPETLAAMAASVDMQRSLGVTSARLVGPDEIERMVPGVATEGLTGGLLGASDGHVDPYGLAQCFCQLAREVGAKVRERCRVSTISGERGGRFRLELSDGDTLLADVVVNAAGSWAGQLNAGLGVDLPVVGYRHQVATFEVPADYPDVPFTMDFVPRSGQPGVYFRKEGPRRLVAGLHDDHLDPDTVTDPDRCPEGVEPEFVDLVVAHLAALLPGLVDRLAFVNGWSGLYP
ncbi:MAG: NAD(P)/FAD-dependent oxidoreductase, partial [Candidatus Dormibacteria bacterium]